MLPQTGLLEAQAGVGHFSKGCSSRVSFCVWLSLCFYYLLWATATLKTTWTFFCVCVWCWWCRCRSLTTQVEGNCGLWTVPCHSSVSMYTPSSPPPPPPDPSQCPVAAAVRVLEFLMTDLWPHLDRCVLKVLHGTGCLFSEWSRPSPEPCGRWAGSLFGPLLLGLPGSLSATP